MGLPAEFDDRQTHLESEADAYHPYEYQTENNESWAGALPVKQYVSSPLRSSRCSSVTNYICVEDCMIQAWKKMRAVSVLPGMDMPILQPSLKESTH